MDKIKKTPETIESIEILTKQGQNVLCDRSGGTLSPISWDILDCVLSKDVTIILAQGPLNLTPLISTIFAWYHKRDVLVGLPNKDFNKKYDNYTKTFFSLLYGSGGHYFFYKDVLWIKGELDDYNEELCNLTIETYPKHGDAIYKMKYDSQIKEELETGRCVAKPFVVFIPTQRIPAGVIGQKPVKYKNESYRLKQKQFDPGLVVLESVNEGSFDLERISSLIQNIRKMRKKLVVHFSWPYLRGLDDFLKQHVLQGDPKIAVFHLGKRLCLELQDDMQKPPSYAVPISLEGELWNTIYYPGKGTHLDYKIMLPPLANLDSELNEQAVSHFDSTNDNWQQGIREHIIFEKIQDPIAESIVRFPPVVDSFLYPSEIKIRSYRPEGNIVHITLQDYIAEKLGRGSTIRRLYGGLSSDLQRSRDLSYELRGLCTHSAASKKTLLQTYVLETLQTGIEAVYEQTIDGDIPRREINVVMLNLYPLLGSRGALLDSLSHLFDSVSCLLEQVVLPSVFIEGDKLRLKFEPELSCEFDNSIEVEDFGARNLARHVTSNREIPVAVDYSYQSNEAAIAVSLDLNSDYLEFDQRGSQGIKKKHMRPLTLYAASTKLGDNFKELSLRGLQTKRYPHLNKLHVTADLAVKTSAGTKESVVELNLTYLEPYQIKRLTREQITRSRLIIPGAIPFFTISDDALMICEHFDTLLLPFEQIVFFAYPGNNFKRLLKQIRSYNDIFSKEPTTASTIDLEFSLKHTTLLKGVSIFELADRSDDMEYKIEGDTAIDVAIRHDEMQSNSADDVEQLEITTLRAIWDRIRRSQKVDAAWGCDGTRIFSKISRKPQMFFRVVFGDNRIEDISFEAGSLLRKKIGTDFEICPIEELAEGDEILYIESAERESVDNYLLRDFMLQKEIQLEQILEPVTSLKLFYEVVRCIKASSACVPEKIASIYWLSDTQKTILFNTIQSLVQWRQETKTAKSLSQNGFYQLKSDHFWSDFLQFDELASIFSEGSSEVTYRKLYEIAKKAGMKLEQRSFGALCSSAIHEHKHYFFREEENLLALGKLLGHQELINSYEVVNELGKDIGTTLQLIGRCVARVSSGRSEALNQMDASIEDKLRKCRILSISF